MVFAIITLLPRRDTGPAGRPMTRAWRDYRGERHIGIFVA
jgi:hypothetical protein